MSHFQNNHAASDQHPIITTAKNILSMRTSFLIFVIRQPAGYFFIEQ